MESAKQKWKLALSANPDWHKNLPKLSEQRLSDTFALFSWARTFSAGDDLELQKELDECIEHCEREQKRRISEEVRQGSLVGWDYVEEDGKTVMKPIYKRANE